MQRLLYVALTRARHTLVLAGDRELFAKANGNAPEASFTKWFQADTGELNESRIGELDTKAETCAPTRAEQSSELKTDTAAPAAALPDLRFQQALARARNFPHRMLPSSFSPPAAIVETTGADKWKETENEFRATTVPSMATQYGIWWHEFVQQIRWREDFATWDSLFEAALPNSPDKNRSKKEWNTLSEFIRNGNDFAGRLRDHASRFHAELPFLWNVDARRCLEGVVDLAVFEPAGKTCLILDWKTNQIKPDRIDRLRAHYLPQLAAYWKAVTEMTKMEVAAAIYSTAAGALVRYDGVELADEWQRIEQLPPDDLAAVLKSDARGPSSEPRDQKPPGKPTQLEFLDL